MKEKYNILIGEDEYLCLLGVRTIIQNLGHTVIGEASDGDLLVEMATSLKPDLMLVDINMPKKDGIDAIKAINEKFYVPSIIISGYHDEEMIKRASEEGVLYYLVKPVDEKDLKIAINIAMSKFEEIKTLHEELDQTKKMLEARKKIEHAKGILMDRMKLKEGDAMKKLQKMSRDKNIKLIDVAQQIINAEEIFRN
jgi:response regulator NasT